MLTQAQRTDRLIAMTLEVFGAVGGEREPLLDFIPRVTPRIAGRATVRPEHLEQLVDVLQRAHREPLRVLLSVPPRHAKTETVLHAIAWILRDDPSALLAYIGYGADFARSKSRSARDYAVKAGVVLREDANALSEWLTPNGGGLRSGGIGGPLNGLGFRVIVVDDPIKNRQDAESRLIRQRNWDWFTSTAMTRLEPDGSMIVVHTRWHEDDLIGRCLKEREKYDETDGAEGEPWVHINLQAIDDETGQALWPEVWPLEKLKQKKASVGEYDWVSLYQGHPRPRDAKPFGRDPARFGPLDLSGKRIGIALDPAGTKRTRSDWSVAVVFAYWWVLHEEHGDQLWMDIFEVHRWQEEIPEVAENVAKIQERWNVPLIIESVGIGKAVPQTLRKAKPSLDITEIHPTQDKYLRSQAYSAAWKGGRVRVPNAAPNLTEFIKVHKDFTGIDDPIDDDVDAGAHGLNWAFDQGPFYDTDSGRDEPIDFPADFRFGDQRGF